MTNFWRISPLIYSISPNVRTYVYKYGMRSGGTEFDWDFMWNKYRNETVPQEKIKLLYGLANTKQVWLLNRYMFWLFDRSDAFDFISMM